MVIKVNNKNEEKAKEESERLYNFLMRVRQARKDFEAENGALHLKRIEMYVDFQKGECDATYTDDNAVLYMTHKIDDLEAFVKEVLLIFGILEGTEQK